MTINTETEYSAGMIASAAGISYRNFSYYKSEGLIPLSERQGPRGGMHPAWVLDLTKWIVRLRSNDVPLEVVRDFIPYWAAVVRDQGHGAVITCPRGREWWLPSIIASLPNTGASGNQEGQPC